MKGQLTIARALRSRLSGLHGMPAYIKVDDVEALMFADAVGTRQIDVKHPDGFTHIEGRYRGLRWAAYGADMSRDTIDTLLQIIDESVYRKLADAQASVNLRTLSMLEPSVFTKYLEGANKESFWKESRNYLVDGIDARLAALSQTLPEFINRYDFELRGMPSGHPIQYYSCPFCKSVVSQMGYNGNSCAHISADINDDEHKMTYDLHINTMHHYLLHPAAFISWLEEALAWRTTRDAALIEDRIKRNRRRTRDE